MNNDATNVENMIGRNEFFETGERVYEARPHYKQRLKKMIEDSI